MGGFCSDPGTHPGTHDLQYGMEAEHYLQDLSNDESESECTMSRHSRPSIKKLTIPANHLRAYRSEAKKRDCFFDLDSVDEVLEVAGKAFSDITSLRYQPKKPSRLTKANLSIRDNKQNSWTGSLRHNGQKERFNSSNQAGWNSNCPRSVCSDQVVYTRKKSYENDEKCQYKFNNASRVYCRDDKSLNASSELDEKSENESDSLEFPKPRTETRESLNEGMFLEREGTEDSPGKIVKLGAALFIKVSKLKPSSPNTSDTDGTSLRNSGSPETCVRRQQRDDLSFNAGRKERTLKRDNNHDEIKHHFRQLPKVPMLIHESSDSLIELHTHRSQQIVLNGKMCKRNDADEGVIFSSPKMEDIQLKSGPPVYTKEHNNHVTLP